MKNIIGLLLYLIISGCNDPKNTEQKDVPPFPATVHIEYEEHNFPLYEENSHLRSILDSLTESINICPKTKYEDHVLLVGLENQADTLKQISINLMRRKDLYCEYIAGIVVHNHRYFILSQTSTTDTLFLNTGLTVNFKCRKEDSFTHDPKEYFLGWTYILNKRNFICISYNICGKSWYDKKYFKFDESE
jgi:hypothetical protein